MGFENVFTWSFYSQGVNEAEISVDSFLRELSQNFGISPKPTTSKTELVTLLRDELRNKRFILVLDGLEPLQNPPGVREGELKDFELRKLLLYLGTLGSHCKIVITSRFVVNDLNVLPHSSLKTLSLTSIGTEAARELFRANGVVASEVEIDKIIDGLDGHALSIALASSFVREALDGDVRLWNNVFLTNEESAIGSHAQRVVAAYGKWLAEGEKTSRRSLQCLRLLGLFDRPIEFELIERLAAEADAPSFLGDLKDASRIELRQAVSRLCDLGLVSEYGAVPKRIDCHPLIREYFAKRLSLDHSLEIQKMHRIVSRHFELLADTNPHASEATGWLFQAVRHACLASDFRHGLEIYSSKINKNTATFIWLNKGQHVDVVNCMQYFFETFPSRIKKRLTKSEQRVVYNQAGCTLTALGRVKEAKDILIQNIKTIQEDDRDGQSASINLCNIAAIDFFRGDTTSLLDVCEHAVNAFDCVANLRRINGESPKNIPWTFRLDALLLYSIGLSHAGELEKAWSAFQYADDWFGSIYVNANDLYVDEMFYLQCNILASWIRAKNKCSGHQLRLLRRLRERYMSLQRNPRSDTSFGLGMESLGYAEVLIEAARLIDNFPRKELLDTLRIRSAIELVSEIRRLLQIAEMHLSKFGHRLWLAVAQLRLLRFDMMAVVRNWKHEIDTRIVKLTIDELEQLCRNEIVRTIAVDLFLEKIAFERNVRRSAQGVELARKSLNNILAINLFESFEHMRYFWSLAVPRPAVFGSCSPQKPIQFRFRMNEISSLD